MRWGVYAERNIDVIVQNLTRYKSDSLVFEPKQRVEWASYPDFAKLLDTLHNLRDLTWKECSCYDEQKTIDTCRDNPFTASRLLQACMVLETMSIYNCFMDEEFYLSLAKNKTLRTLNITICSKSTDHNLHLLLRALYRNTTITNVGLSGVVKGKMREHVSSINEQCAINGNEERRRNKIYLLWKWKSIKRLY
jgi:hypothetical protein